MRLLAELRGKCVLILGFGREGRSTLAFLQERAVDAELTVADRRTHAQMSAQELAALATLPPDHVTLGPDYLEALANADVIVRSPGMPPDAPPLQQAREAGKRVTSLVNLFFDVAPGRIIGVTGTKGKSTTTSAIYTVLRDAGLDARLGGNIGIPLLSCLEGANEQTVFVVELSSFQLSDLERSPHIAVVQNVVREHLDYHGTFEKYVDAKSNLVRHQEPDDVVIYNGDYPIPDAIAAQSPGTHLAFGLASGNDANYRCRLDNGCLVYATSDVEIMVIPADAVPLAGDHNLLNVMPAIVVGRLLGVEPLSIAASIRSLTALPHRMQLVHEWQGRQFYNDSLCTVPEAAMAAITAFRGRPTILIAGGHDRGQAWDELADAILREQVKAVVLLPETGTQLMAALQHRASDQPGATLPILRPASGMAEAVRCAIEVSEAGAAILLSPAAASFGAFRDYEDRGNQFREAAIRLTAEADGRAPSP